MLVKEVELVNNEWDYDSLLVKIMPLFKEIDDFTDKKSIEIKNIDANMKYINYLYGELLLRYPNIGVNIFIEKLLTAILKKDFEIALKIAQDRIAKNDSGRFLFGNKSFYELAEEYIKAIQ